MPVGSVCLELVVLPVNLYMYVCVSPQGVSIEGNACWYCLSGVGGVACVSVHVYISAQGVHVSMGVHPCRCCLSGGVGGACVSVHACMYEMSSCPDYFWVYLHVL